MLPDGSVTAFFGKTEMGQGVDVAIAQIVAEELDVAFDKVNVVMGDTAFTCNQGGASGSTGVQLGGLALRNAAAEARRVLVEMGAKQLGVPVERAHGGERRGDGPGLRAAARELRRADRRPALPPQARVEQASTATRWTSRARRSPRRPRSTRSSASRSRRRSSPTRCWGASSTSPTCKRGGHAARARDPPAQRRLQPGLGGRGLDQGHPRRARGAGEGLSSPSSPSANGTRCARPRPSR